MKKSIPKYLIILLLSVVTLASFSSCKTGYGCESTEQYKAQTNKKGQLSNKRGKSNLFGKKTRKKVRKS